MPSDAPEQAARSEGSLSTETDVVLCCALDLQQLLIYCLLKEAQTQEDDELVSRQLHCARIAVNKQGIQPD